MVKITLDEEVFKALSSETRVNILKELDGKQLTVTQLSTKTGLSKSAIHRHLEQLKGVDLIKKDAARKWVYYRLTWKATNILHPERARIVTALSISILLIVVGTFLFAAYAIGELDVTESAPGVEPALAHNVLYLFGGISCLVVSSVLSGVSWWLWNTRKPFGMKNINV